MVKVSDLDPAVVTDLDEVHFGVDQTDLSATRRLTLTDMQTLGPSAVVDTVADLATATPRDGQLWQTRGRLSASDGGGKLFVYDAGATDLVNGGTVINGPSSVGRYLAIENHRLDIRQFGAVGDGVTDDTAAISAAAGALVDGGVLYIPEGRFLTTGSLVTAPCKIEGPGTLVVDIDDYAFHVNLSGWGAAQTITAIADANLGTASLAPQTSQITSTTHGVVQGDVIKITADTTYGKVSGDFVGELAKVIRVVDADNFVVEHQLEDIAAAFGGTMAFRKLPSGYVNIDVNVDFVDGSQAVARTNQEPLVEITGAIDPFVRVRVAKSYARAFQGSSIFKGQIEVYTQDLDDTTSAATNPLNEFGYGVVLGGGSYSTTVKISQGGGRHAFTTRDFTTGSAYSTDLARMQESGASRDILVHDSMCVGSYLAAFDTHLLCRRVRFMNCHAIYPATLDTGTGALPVSFQDRGQNTEYHNCSSKNARVAWQLDGGDFWDTHIVMEGCSDVGSTTRTISFTNAASTDPILEVHGHRSTSSCMWLEIQEGRAILKDIYWKTITSFGQANIQFNANSIVSAHGIYHIAGASALAPFRANTSATCSLRLRDYHVERTAGTPHGLLDSATGSTFTVDVDDASFSSFPAEGIIRTASAGTVTIVSDSWRSGGRRVEFRTSAPVSGVHRVGDITWNTAPAAGGTMGWVCTTAGNPGTWKTFGTIAP